MNVLRGVYRFIYDFIIGDDWKIALAALLSLAAGLAVISTGVFIGIAVPLTAVVIAVAFGIALMIDVRRQ
ncbi:hypothetical protein DFJ67_6059 [Asanoa ferruginea]|uniref:Uncharacterized protein n=1 Tax=Asanoa ferruginea TaxID=53367 RepID=A0A3D9ZU62_9ACTN|nr:hypothetical protein [Asanoa ferruginea]REG00013.1 hypothetical protein DFJ67_6059 [Asanoa ferruginea]GIF51751.1 hypothetical protein Afe04nite_62900 [Asanoa ferruginea]